MTPRTPSDSDGHGNGDSRSDRMRRRAIVSGRVQGVGFRWSTAERARASALDGHVVNLVDGTVEVEVEGSPDAVAAMVSWLESGPPGARVERVDITALDPRSPGAQPPHEVGFRIL